MRDAIFYNFDNNEVLRTLIKLEGSLDTEINVTHEPPKRREILDTVLRI